VRSSLLGCARPTVSLQALDAVGHESHALEPKPSSINPHVHTERRGQAPTRLASTACRLHSTRTACSLHTDASVRGELEHTHTNPPAVFAADAQGSRAAHVTRKTTSTHSPRRIRPMTQSCTLAQHTRVLCSHLVACCNSVQCMYPPPHMTCFDYVACSKNVTSNVASSLACSK
jgi:hypothetical protein